MRTPEHQQAAVIEYVDPIVNALPDKYTGKSHVVSNVVISFLRDINIFYAEDERGEYTAIIPVRVTFKREI